MPPGLQEKDCALRKADPGSWITPCAHARIERAPSADSRQIRTGADGRDFRDMPCTHAAIDCWPTQECEAGARRFPVRSGFLFAPTGRMVTYLSYLSHCLTRSRPRQI